MTGVMNRRSIRPFGFGFSKVNADSNVSLMSGSALARA